MSPTELLLTARAAIANPNNWWSRGLARELGYNLPLDWTSRRCATQALYDLLVGGEVQSEVQSVDLRNYRTAESLLAKACDPTSHSCAFDTIVNFNDTHTHAEVLAAYDRAIEMSREEGGE